MGSNGGKETNSEKIALYARKHKKYRVKNVQRADVLKASLPQDKTGTPAAEERRQPCRNEVYSGRQQKTEHIQSENVLSDVSETTNPEMAERLKKAAFIERRNAENIKINRTAAVHDDENRQEGFSDVPVEHLEETVKKAAEKPEDVIADIVIPDHVRAITPEMAERLKRAAYIEQKNAEAIRLNRATVIRETEKETQETNTDNVEPAENIPDVPVGHREENEDNSPNGTPPDSADTDLHSDDVREYRERKAYHDFSGKHKRESKKYFGVSDGYPHKRNDDAEKSGDAAVGTAFGENAIKTAYEAETAAQTINNSDSIGSTVLDLSAVLSVVEAKKMVKKLAGTDLKKQERVSERMKNHGNRFGIGSIAKDEEIRDKAEKIKYSEDQPKQYEGDGKKRRHYKVGNGIRLNEEKQKYAKNQKSKEIRNKRKEIFIKENSNIPETIVSSKTVKDSLVKRFLKTKALPVILGGGALTAAVPVMLAAVVFVLISSFFGWLSPFEYSLAGDETGPDTDQPPVHSAETKAEVIEGYTLMVKNYMDITQAYYYLNYGDWYGGVYAFESAGLDFGTFFSDYCQSLTEAIQAQYQSLIAQASTPQEAMILTSMMTQAINQALANAHEPALAEYNALYESLTDELTPNEQRQPYEVTASQGSSGIDDITEFNGKPVAGTNNFGNQDINSELAAEEMLAYIALYKSLMTMNPADTADDDEEPELNITPQDIMDFFEQTEYITITAEITHDNPCSGMNCKRRLIQDDSGTYWEYYCDSDHDNLSGEIGECLTAEELLDKIIELTGAEENCIDAEQGQEIIRSYIDMFKEELDIEESDFREFGAADNSKAQEFYEMLVTDELSGADIWNVDTPFTEEVG